jgi:hypothetical protein
MTLAGRSGRAWPSGERESPPPRHMPTKSKVAKAAPKKRAAASRTPKQTQVSAGLQVEKHPLVTEVRLALDRPRKLRFTMAEASEFKRRTGISVWKQGINVGELEEEQFLELLAVCCLADDPAVTAAELAPALAGKTLLDATAALLVVVGDFVETPEDILENPLMASALIRLMSSSTGRSPLRRSGSRTSSSGASRLD